MKAATSIGLHPRGPAPCSNGRLGRRLQRSSNPPLLHVLGMPAAALPLMLLLLIARFGSVSALTAAATLDQHQQQQQQQQQPPQQPPQQQPQPQSHWHSRRQLVAGGRPLRQPLQFPFVAVLTGPDGRPSCGAAVLGPRIVLTAAHCEQPVAGLHVEVHRHNLSTQVLTHAAAVAAAAAVVAAVVAPPTTAPGSASQLVGWATCLAALACRLDCHTNALAWLAPAWLAPARPHSRRARSSPVARLGWRSPPG